MVIMKIFPADNLQFRERQASKLIVLDNYRSSNFLNWLEKRDVVIWKRYHLRNMSDKLSKYKKARTCGCSYEKSYGFLISAMSKGRFDQSSSLVLKRVTVSWLNKLYLKIGFSFFQLYQPLWWNTFFISGACRKQFQDKIGLVQNCF